jgi:hypothetical protein
MNAAAVILSHNHSSGHTEPSQADRTLTARLKEALGLVDVRTLDHIIVAGRERVSLAELGLSRGSGGSGPFFFMEISGADTPLKPKRVGASFSACSVELGNQAIGSNDTAPRRC